MTLRHRLKCRKGYRKEEWNCQILSNGTQKGSFNVKRGRIGYTIMPHENTGCGAEVAVSLDRVLRIINDTLKSGKCEWKPVAMRKGGRIQIANYGVLHACLMKELRSKLKKREGGS